MFFGTPEFAVPVLAALLEGPDRVVGVVCQPDRPAGRGHQVQSPPVKQLALAGALPTIQPEKIRTPEFVECLRAWNADLAVVAAYGRILPKAVLETPRLGCINVHASLLPKYRGAAPIQWAILRGEPVTGITIMYMNERMDEGDVLLRRETPIGPQETYGELQGRLSRLGAEALMDALDGLHRGQLAPVPQDHAAATLAPMVEKEDGRIEWSRPAEEIARMVRAFNPWPSAYTSLRGKLLKIHRARAISERVGLVPGSVVSAHDDILVGTGLGLLAVDELQLEGRKRLGSVEFLRSGILSAGVILGENVGTG